MPWSALKRDPLRFLSQECFPERFQWNDPSHLREAFAVQLVDHIWDMQNPGLGREPALFRFHHVESRKGPDSPLVPAAYSGTPTPIPERARIAHDNNEIKANFMAVARTAAWSSVCCDLCRSRHIAHGV